MERRRLVEDGAGGMLQMCAGAWVESAKQGQTGTVGGDSVIVLVMMVIDLHKGVWWEEEPEFERGRREGHSEGMD